MANPTTKDQNMHASWKLMSLRASVWMIRSFKLDVQEQTSVSHSSTKTVEQLHKVCTPGLQTINSKRKNWKRWRIVKVCSQIVLKCFFLARIGRFDILRSVYKLARAVTKWTRACDRRLARLISYIHHTR